MPWQVHPNRLHDHGSAGFGVGAGVGFGAGAGGAVPAARQSNAMRSDGGGGFGVESRGAPDMLR